MALSESQYIVYLWNEDGELHFVRSVFLRHEIGEQVTDEMLREQIVAELHDFKPGKYRAVPADRKVDFTITAQVELAV